jgi:hypothetical protein
MGRGSAWAIALQKPISVTLRDHDALLVESASHDDIPFVYNLGDGAETECNGAEFRDSLFERPGHPELWIWIELGGGALYRCDLTTGAMDEVLHDVDSVDYRPDRDELVYNTFKPELGRLSLATGKDLVPLRVVPDPNDVTAPCRLQDL